MLHHFADVEELDAQHAPSRTTIKQPPHACTRLRDVLGEVPSGALRGYIPVPRCQAPSRLAVHPQRQPFGPPGAVGAAPSLQPRFPLRAPKKIPRHLCLQKTSRSHPLHLSTQRCKRQQETQAGCHHPTGPVLTPCPP